MSKLLSRSEGWKVKVKKAKSHRQETKGCGGERDKG